MSRVVLITGTSSGVGLAVAMAFGRSGDVVVATMRDPARCAALEQAAADEGVSVDVVALDVTSDDSVAAAFHDLLDNHGRLDVLVNCAGVGTSATLEELTIEDLRHSLEVNYLGVARTTKAALPIMRQGGRGHIIAVSDVAGVVGQPFNDAYCASKHALEGLFESLHPVATALGVHVCIVEPGPVATGFHDSTERIDSSDEQIARLKGRYRGAVASGLARGQDPEEVAAVILGVADDPAPPLRTQTSRHAARLLEPKLADLTGERIAATASRWLEPDPRKEAAENAPDRS